MIEDGDARAALAQVNAQDEEAARQAFDTLCRNGRPVVERFLRYDCRVRDPQDRADIAQDAFARLWAARQRFVDQGPAAWQGLLRRCAYRCYVDWLRARGLVLGDEDLEQRGVPQDERADVEAMAVAHATQGQIWRLADALWLELDLATPPERHNRRLLAAQLFYLHGESWQRLLRLLGPEPPGDPPLTRATLDEWLSDPGVLRRLACTHLYCDGDTLAAHLLGLPEELGARERASALDALAYAAAEKTRQGAAVAEEALHGWSWAEVAVLQWRYRNALLREQIERRDDCRLSPAALEALLEKARARFPFRENMDALLDGLARSPGARERAALDKPQLWQRLAFQYRYNDDLPLKDIFDRLQPAAERVGYRITPEALNGWLGGGRLLAYLARFWRRTVGEAEEQAADPPSDRDRNLEIFR